MCCHVEDRLWVEILPDLHQALIGCLASPIHGIGGIGSIQQGGQPS